MFRAACRKATRPAVFAGCALAFVALPALAEEARYCVTCTNPNQTYVCRVTAGGAKPSDALKLYCVIRTAKEGNHASCSAVRSETCNGIEKIYAYDGPLPEDFASDRRINKVREKIEQEQRAFEKPKGDGPDTLVELTGRAVSASKQRLRDARSALGGSSEPTGEPLPQENLSPNETPPVASQEAPPAQADAGDRPGFARRSYRCMLSLFRNCRDDQPETEPVP